MNSKGGALIGSLCINLHAIVFTIFFGCEYWLVNALKNPSSDIPNAMAKTPNCGNNKGIIATTDRELCQHIWRCIWCACNKVGGKLAIDSSG